ncbi:hypothetical protein [Agromyces silvae]|uniref:hypothetical protein n=1 Tax=Agromyces silvae TaxID=3388266 RepID=UPI00280AD005|nr:hypothetical protein [Agromyces protaetiae]
MWRTAPNHPITPARSLTHDDVRRRPHWRRTAVAIGLIAALTGAGAAPALAAPEHQGVIAWGSQTPLPIPTAAESGVAAVSINRSLPLTALALKTDGTVIGWGNNANDMATPPPAAQSGVEGIAVGSTFSMVLKADGSVVAWGATSAGQTPAPPAAQSGVVGIAAGATHALAVKSDGSVIGWGSNSVGEITIPPAAQSGVIAVAASSGFSLALKSDGTVVGWGLNFAGQATPPPGLANVTAISAGSFHALALRSDGSVVGWGDNGAAQAAPPPAASSGVVAISAGAAHSLALKSDGSVVGWGTGTAVSPPPAASSGVVAISAGNEASLAVKDLSVAPTISGTPPSGAVGTPYSFAYDVNGVPAPSTSVFAGTTLPPGLSLSADGVISGTPTEAGTFSFVVVAFNGVSPDAALESTITINQAPTISGTPPGGTVGQPYSFGYTVTGTPAPTVALLAGTSLPPGLTLSAAGVISGTPTTAGTFSFTVEASNGVNPTALLESTITVQAAPKPKADVSVAITGPATAKKGTPVSYQVTVSNAGPQTSVNVGATILVSTDFTIQTIPAGATRIGQLVTFPTASYTAGQQRQFTITLVPKANSGTALLAAATGSLVTPDPKLVNNAAAKSVKLTK